MDLKWVISDEERTRHDALFYSQKPRNRYLSGEQARSLFIRSKLPLPDLSKIWKLADVSRNNMLDISEFAVAMHLIQSRLKGTDIPEKLPETLIPIPVAWVEVPTILQVERKAYERAFSWMDKEKTGYIDAGTVCSILIESQLSKEILAKIWNLSDEDRDGKLSLNEFCVAIHLTRFCKKGNSLDGSVNVKSIVSQEWIEENFEGKKHRLAEVQTEKRKLLSLKEKLCHEIAGDVEEPAIAETIKTELNQVEKELYVLEKEENGLRRTLQQIKDKSKKESFKPFDRSFLLKRHASGEDIFRGTRKQNSASLANEEILEIEKLWSEDGDLADFGVTIEEPPSSPVNYSIRRDQFATVIELNQSQGSIETSATSSGAASPVANGISENEDKRDSIPLHVNNNCIEIDEKRVDVTDQTTTSSESHESETVQVSEEANSEDTENQLMNGSRLSDQQLITIDGPHSPLQQTETDFAPSDLSCTKDMNQNKTDDEKYSSQKLELIADYHNTQVKGGVGKVAFGEYVKGGETPLLLGSLNHRQIPVAESGNLIPTGSKSYLDTSSRVDNLLLQPSSGGGSIAVETRNEEGDMARASSPRSLTQEEFLPIFLEEKRKKDEERARQRQIDEEMRQQARRENYRRMQEENKQAEQRKSVFQEERLRLEQQVSLGKEEQERRKSPVSRVEAGKLIEMELEEQRIREEITRMELEKIKDKEKMEMEKQKLKQAKREEHPSTVLSKDVVQKTISDETNFLETEPFQSLSSRIAGKRGSVIDLSENEGPSSKLEQRPAETKERVYMQPVVRRTPENSWPIASRKDENRKSVVELEIERQKEREEEARREAKNVRRILAQRSSDSLTYQSATDVDGERHRGLENSTVPPPVRKEIIETDNIVGGKPVLRKQMEVETIPQQRTMAMLESPPLDEIDAPLNRNGDELAETTPEETKEEARRKEMELFRQMQDEEKRRREAEKQELDRLKKEVERREAEELMRLKLAREEERSRKREAELKEAAKREKEEEQRHAEQNQAATSRKASFAAHKLILEQRVLKALEETKQEANISKKRSSSLDRPSEFFDQVQTQPSMPVSEASENVSSACVKLRKACFERPAAQTESREEMRNKRYSLNLDQTGRAMIAREDGASCSKHPARSAGQKNQLSYYPDDIVTRESKAQLEREEELLRRVGGKPRVGEGKLAKARSLGDLSRSVDQQDGPMSYQIVRDIPLNGDVTDSGSVPEDGLPVFADVRIRKELQEQRMREEILRKEALEREKRYRLVDEKKKQMEGPSLVGKKDVSLRDIKKNPLPNKIVVKKPQPSSNRDSLTQSMASHWENVLQNQDGNSVTEKKEKKASFIELEKEEERRREEELQRERERGLLEKKKNEEEKELARQRKIQEELEKKRKAKEEKEKRQQRTLAMKSIFEKMGSKK